MTWHPASPSLGLTSYCCTHIYRIKLSLYWCWICNVLPRLWRNKDWWPIPLKKYGDIGNSSGIPSVILPFTNLKYVGILAPTAKLIGDIPYFYVLFMSPKHSLGITLEMAWLMGAKPSPAVLQLTKIPGSPSGPPSCYGGWSAIILGCRT